MTDQELKAVLTRVGTLMDWVVDNPPILRAVAFLLNRFEYGQTLTADQFLLIASEPMEHEHENDSDTNVVGHS